MGERNMYIRTDSDNVYKFNSIPIDYVDKIKNSTSKLEKIYIRYVIERMDKILNKYKSEKIRSNGKWTYYKRIPSKYWHEMMEAYFLFRSVVEVHQDKYKHIFFNNEENNKMKLYINLLPSLSKFEKCQEKKRFNIFERLILDYFYFFSD
jgi:hypothetical protein